MTTEEVGKLGLAITSVSVAFAAGFQRITDQFASLYYTRQLTGQTIQSLKDLQFAAGQVGLSTGDMNSALRALALRLAQPGVKHSSNKSRASTVTLRMPPRL